ncbi:MAG: hypothetical protein ACN6O5_15165 [Achromobacter sp.]|uniref:hypothetical protein n=1 Tax=Achromobacter sp. TaxID=134375 RepID=UPI003D027E07
MDEKMVTAIHELANALAGLGSWQQQLVSMAILLVVAGAGSFFGAYLKTRATNAAMADDLDAIRRQLAATTHTTKSIEAQISKRGELHSLRIKKLEDLMEKFLGARETYRDAFNAIQSIEGVDGTVEDSFPSLLMLAKFYFPQFEAPLKAFYRGWMVCLRETALGRECVLSASNPHKRDEVREVALGLWRSEDFPLKDEAEFKGMHLEVALVNAMHGLLAQAEPEAAERSPA